MKKSTSRSQSKKSSMQVAILLVLYIQTYKPPQLSDSQLARDRFSSSYELGGNYLYLPRGTTFLVSYLQLPLHAISDDDRCYHHILQEQTGKRRSHIIIHLSSSLYICTRYEKLKLYSKTTHHYIIEVELWLYQLHTASQCLV